MRPKIGSCTKLSMTSLPSASYAFGSQAYMLAKVYNGFQAAGKLAGTVTEQDFAAGNKPLDVLTLSAEGLTAYEQNQKEAQEKIQEGSLPVMDLRGRPEPDFSHIEDDWKRACMEAHHKYLQARSGFERANDFSFWAKPTTAEEKKIYNEMELRFNREANWNDFRVDGSLYGKDFDFSPTIRLYGSLNVVEGTDWMIADGAEALIGHQVLSLFETEVYTRENQYGAVNPLINEYGFLVDLPGKYQDLNYLASTFVRPDGSTIKVPILGMDGGQTYEPEINYTDALGLDGMSLDDRKLFLTMAQEILDAVMPGMDVRQLKFSIGHLTQSDLQQGIYSLTLDAHGLGAKDYEMIVQALNTNRLLFEMKSQADASANKGIGELTISVLDDSGNALAKDQVRLLADGKSVVTTVDTIKDMDQRQIFNYIRSA